MSADEPADEIIAITGLASSHEFHEVDLTRSELDSRIDALAQIDEDAAYARMLQEQEYFMNLMPNMPLLPVRCLG